MLFVSCLESLTPGDVNWRQSCLPKKYREVKLVTIVLFDYKFLNGPVKVKVKSRALLEMLRDNIVSTEEDNDHHDLIEISDLELLVRQLTQTV